VKGKQFCSKDVNPGLDIAGKLESIYSVMLKNLFICPELCSSRLVLSKDGGCRLRTFLFIVAGFVDLEEFYICWLCAPIRECAKILEGSAGSSQTGLGSYRNRRTMVHFYYPGPLNSNFRASSGHGIELAHSSVESTLWQLISPQLLSDIRGFLTSNSVRLNVVDAGPRIAGLRFIAVPLNTLGVELVVHSSITSRIKSAVKGNIPHRAMSRCQARKEQRRSDEQHVSNELEECDLVMGVKRCSALHQGFSDLPCELRRH
jgi:hypothetical protein